MDNIDLKHKKEELLEENSKALAVHGNQETVPLNSPSILPKNKKTFVWTSKYIAVIVFILLLATCSFQTEKPQENIQATSQGELAKEFLTLVKKGKYLEIDEISGPAIKYNPFSSTLFKEISNSLQGVNIDELKVNGGEYKEYGLQKIFEPKKWHVYFTKENVTYRVQVSEKSNKLSVSSIFMITKN